MAFYYLGAELNEAFNISVRLWVRIDFLCLDAEMYILELTWLLTGKHNPTPRDRPPHPP